MDKLPILPEHVIRPTIDNLQENEVVFLPVACLLADTTTHQPYLSKDTLILGGDFEPKRLVGRFALMRVVLNKVAADNTPLIEGYVMDIRALDNYTVQPQKMTPTEDDSPETISRLELAAKDYISPIGLVAYDEYAKEQLYCHHSAIQAALLELIDYSDEQQVKIQTKKRAKQATRRKNQLPSSASPDQEIANTLDSRRSE